MITLVRTSAALVLCSVLHAATALAGPADDQAAEILESTGVNGGLIVHVGCGDGRLTAALRASDAYLVEGLDTDAKNVQAARRHIDSLGLSGKASADTFDGKHLPYADNLVNLVLVSGVGVQVSADEITRVLKPGGVALVAQGLEFPDTRHLTPDTSSLSPTWTKFTKSWPDTIDQWTHYLHDASGNAVAHDLEVAAPKHLQWIGGPLWSRSHEYDASLCAMVSADGRLFYIFDEGPTGIIDRRIPDKWKLIARDAFNGVVLWKQEIRDWGWKAWKRAEMEQIDWRRMPSQRFRLPVAIPRRLVAVDDRVYATLGYRAPLTALDAATGRTVKTYADTERTDEIVHQDGLLVLCIRTSMEGANVPTGKKGKPGQRAAAAAALVAIEADTGRRVWETEPGTVVPLSLAVSNSQVFYHDQDAVVCLDAATGKMRWRTPTGGAGNSVWNTDLTLAVYKDVVLSAGRRQLLAMSAVDGKVLWKLPAARGWGIINPPDLFVADDVVWYGQGNLHADSITGYDPLTGKPVRTVDLGFLITRGHHARCYRSKATDNYLLLPKRAIEFVDLKGGQHSRHNWVRGGCRYGVLPCNGLLYSTPHPCFCYAGAKLGGFAALAGERETGNSKLETRSVVGRLEKGPAFGAVSGQQSAVSKDDWPMYRHDAKRSGGTATAVDPQIQPVWKAELGGRLTQAVVAGGRLFVGRVDAGQICCLDAVSGVPVWDYIAGGRIDSAPTVYTFVVPPSGGSSKVRNSAENTKEPPKGGTTNSLVLFGSADGWVYCLRASDGRLVWRFRAAPDDRRVVAFGQVESAWPVHGSVLVLNDTVYFTAGRSSYLDGGVFLYGLDPVTGEKRYETKLDGPPSDLTVLDENAYAMEGTKSDILVTDGKLIYLFHNAFNTRLEKQPTPIKGELGERNLGERDFGEHLLSNAGFLDDSGFSRSYWMVADQWPAFNFAHQSPKAGQLVVFDGTTTYSAKYFARRNMLSPLSFPATDGYFLVADSNATRPVQVRSDGKGGPEFMRWLPQTGDLQTCWNLGVGFARSEPAKWLNNVPVRIRAMVATETALFAAGPPDECDPDDPAAALEGRRGGVLMALNPNDGKKLSECKLNAPPVFDGMSAAAGRLYLSTNDGQVTCMAAK